MYEFLEYRVVDVMVEQPVTVRPDLSLAEAERIFAAHDFNALPVVDDGVLVGLLTKLDLLRAFAFTPRAVVPPYEEIMRQSVESVMTRTPLTVDPELPLTRVLHLMVETRCKSFPVVRGERLVGIVGREDLLAALRRAATGERPVSTRDRPGTR